MKHRYSVITIVCNPNSTGRSEQKARDLVNRLKIAMPTAKIRLRFSKRRGHGEQIAYRTALLTRHALIISVSGDGGYHDVINGVMRAKRLGRHVTVGLVPAGNANDHYASRHRGDFVKRVTEADEDEVELMRLKFHRVMRYGHSYIGLGVTPQAGEKLNAKKLNPWEEFKIITSVFMHMKSIKIIVDGAVRRYDSLIFSNVGRMSKVIRVLNYDKANDGKVEMSYVYNRNKFKLIGNLVQAAMFGLAANEQVSDFRFETIRTTAVQIDGEVIKIPGDTDVRITVVESALQCIV